MRHPRGADLSLQGFGIKAFHVYDEKFLRTLRDLPQWEILGGRCAKCGHVGWLDKRSVMAKIGNHYLINVRQRLRCSSCGYRGDNEVLIGYLDRNI